MDAMPLSDMLFWLSLTIFGTGTFVIFEKHVIWGIALIVIGLAGMATCAWPYFKSQQIFAHYLNSKPFSMAIFLVLWLCLLLTLTTPDLHQRLHGWLGFAVVGLAGAILSCGYWWVTGKMLRQPSTSSTNIESPAPTSTPPVQNPKQDQPRQAQPSDTGGTKPMNNGQTEKPHHTNSPVAEPAKTPISPSVSQSNSGGINVQQTTTGQNSPIIDSPITIGTVPRRILAKDMLDATSILSSAKNKARIKIAVDQGNSANFADDFYKTVKDAGWPMEDEGADHFIGFGPPGKRFQGAVIVIKGEPLKPGETVYFDASDPMNYIGRVLEFLKVPRILRREPTQPEGRILIQFEGGLPD